MRAVILNLGCKVNQYEGDLLAQGLKERGINVLKYGETADIYVINTCAVTAEAEKKSRQAVQRCLAYNPEARIFVCGCASQNNPASFEKNNVVYVSGVAKKDKILASLDAEYFAEVSCLPKEYDVNEGILNSAGRERAYVKIQDGCNRFCSYCLIPYLRGRSRSKAAPLIAEEVERLTVSGAKEIILTGINMMQYGEDINSSLPSLIRELKKYDVRIRLSSFYVEGLTEELLDSLYGLKNFCSHFHLSLQSGDDGILKKMNRRYSAEEYMKKVELIRKYDKNAGLTTDVIVGFPTETQQNHKNSMAFIEKAEFSDFHYFPYSPRVGTAAYSMPRVDAEEIKKRKLDAAKLKEKLRRNFAEKNLGAVQKVLIEECKDNIFVGHSENYLKVYTERGREGEIIEIIPKKIYKDGVKGELKNE